MFRIWNWRRLEALQVLERLSHSRGVTVKSLSDETERERKKSIATIARAGRRDGGTTVDVADYRPGLRSGSTRAPASGNPSCRSRGPSCRRRGVLRNVGAAATVWDQQCLLRFRSRFALRFVVNAIRTCPGVSPGCIYIYTYTYTGAGIRTRTTSTAISHAKIVISISWSELSILLSRCLSPACHFTRSCGYVNARVTAGARECHSLTHTPRVRYGCDQTGESSFRFVIVPSRRP